MPKGRKPIDIEWRIDRFIQRLDDGSDHWIWLGELRADKEPRISVQKDGKRKVRAVHRYLWEKIRGPAPRYITSACGVHACVNPHHYEETLPGTKPRKQLSQEEICAIVSEGRRSTYFRGEDGTIVEGLT